MYILSVIPIARITGHETLTYFSTENVAAGSVVSVPVRNRTTSGIVIMCDVARGKKTELRTMPFALKKARGLDGGILVPAAFVNAAHSAAEYYATTTGAVLNSFIPGAVLESAQNNRFKRPTPLRNTKNPEHQNDFGIFLLLAEINERVDHYKRLVRESFAQNGSILIMASTESGAAFLYSELSRGIEQHAFYLTGKTAKKDIRDTWATLAASAHPILLIGTPRTILAAPRNDIGLIIIDDEAGPGFIELRRPFCDARKVAELYAREMHARLIFAGSIARIETIHRRTALHDGRTLERGAPSNTAHSEEGIYDLIPPMVQLTAKPEQRQYLIDMRAYKAEPDKTGLIFSNELRAVLDRTATMHERTVLFVARRGLSPTTVCNDCDTVVTCSRCSAPVVLHKTALGPRFLCHKCGREREPENTCAICQGSRFATLGIGSELVAQMLKETAPALRCFRIDADTTGTRSKAERVLVDFFKTKNAVLICTEMALPLLVSLLSRTASHHGGVLPADRYDRHEADPEYKPRLHHAAVISLDSLLSLPDFRINERVMAIVGTLRTIAHHTLIIQTRSAEQQVLDLALHGNVHAFYQKELGEREMLDYPPFSTFIKITLAGKEETVRQEMSDLKQFLGMVPVRTFPAFTAVVRNKFIMHALIKLPKDSWPNNELVQKLRSLPPQFSIQVDPESVL